MASKNKVSGRPSIKEISLQITPDCFSRWFDLGILLDVPVQKLRDIKFSDNNDQPDFCCMRMFTEWLDGNANPTWDVLSEAVGLALSTLPVVEESSLVNLCGKEDIPELAELVVVITPHYAAQWRRIGALLHITGGTLDAIEQEHPINLNWCCNKMLQTWIDTDESASWKTLVAIIDSLRTKQAPNIEETEKPSLKEFVLHVKPQVQCLNTWFNLGVLLDIPVQTLEDIRESEQDDLDLCCVKLLTEWLDNGTNTTWSTLLRAVSSFNIGSIGIVGRPQLVEVIKSVTPQHTTQWKHIGSKLNISSEYLQEVKLGYPTNTELCCIKMLQKWLEVDNEASWDQLHMAISSLHDDTVSDAAVIPVIDKLQADYKATRYINSADDWPPDQPNHFTAVALIHHQEKSTQKEVISVATLVSQGIRSHVIVPSYVSEAETEKITKDISEVFAPLHENVAESILIEGTPGIGKTVLCKEIAYRWATKQFLLDKALLFLLFLRDPHVQQLKSVLKLVNYCCSNGISSTRVVAQLTETQGSDLVLLFDGYDEISESIRQESFIADIIFRRVLPKCTLVITSRPSAASQLHSNISCRVEILGFTSTDRQQFIQESLRDLPERAVALQNYLDENIFINTLCYIPLVMTILLCLFKASIELPKTQTELYQKFICQTIMHFLKKTGSPVKSIESLSDLEQPYLCIVNKLAKISFKLLGRGKIVFTADDVLQISRRLDISSESCTQLGLLKETRYSSTKQATPVSSYSFLHLSVQEFFAAMHVSSLSFFQQTEILQRTFWSPEYFNMWIMYMGLTAGKKNAFKYFLSTNFASFIKNRIFRRNVISKQVLVDKIKCLHLFHCFQEANKDTMCAIVGRCFTDLTVDLSNQTLLPRDVNVLCFYLLRSAKIHWNKLALSHCSIGDVGCNVMYKSVLVSGKSNLFLQCIDFSNNQLTVQSVAAIVDLVCYCKAVELNIADNPLHNMLLQFAGEFKHLKSLVTGNTTSSDDQSINEIMKLVKRSSLQYVSINNNKNSSLILRKANFEVLSFPTTYLQTYHSFVLEDCEGSNIPNDKLLQLLKAQKKLTYFCACNNGFSVSALFSVCTRLVNMLSIEAVVIAEDDLSHSAINETAIQLSSIPNCSITIYSKHELKCIGAILTGHPSENKMDCKTAHIGLPNEQPANIIEDFNFYENKPYSLLYLSKIPDFVSLKILCITRASITEKAADELALTLCQSTTLSKFELSDSQVTDASANKLIQSLKNVSTLESLTMRGCGLTGCEADILFTNNCTLLTEVDISNNKLRNFEIIKALKDCCNLKIFKINGNNFTDEASQAVSYTCVTKQFFFG